MRYWRDRAVGDDVKWRVHAFCDQSNGVHPEGERLDLKAAPFLLPPASIVAMERRRTRSYRPISGSRECIPRGPGESICTRIRCSYGNARRAKSGRQNR